MLDAGAIVSPRIARAASLSLASLGGLALACAAPPLAFWPGVFVACTLLCAALDVSLRAGLGLGALACAGLAFGFVVHAVGLYSLGEVFVRFSHLSPVLAWALASLTWLLQALPYALAALLAGQLAPARVWLALPTLLAATTSLVPQLFPWQPGALLVNAPRYAQIAELGGAPLVTLCAAFAGAAAFALIRRREAAAAWVLVAALAVPAAYGAVRLPSLRAARAAAPKIRLGAVQPNAGKASVAAEPEQLALLKQMRAMTRALEAQHVAATLWAESTYALPLSRKRAQQPGSAWRVVGDGVRGPVLLGAITHDARDAFNSAWLVDAEGRLGARVDKALLLPFAEYLPFWHDSTLLQRRYASPGLSSGRGGTIPIAHTELGVLICYEDLFAELARTRALEGARALVNLSNDGWFGHSHEPALHDLVARMRSIETRRELLRVTNTGVSSHSAASGELLFATSSDAPAAFVAELAPHAELTPYVRLGDWVPPACLLHALGLWAYSASARRRLSGLYS
jgi:apolipoprotein N-acyltransferase